MEIKNNSFAENSLFREKRALFFAKSEAVRLAEEATKQAKETTRQAELQNKYRLKLAKLGILPEGATTPVAAANPASAAPANAPENAANAAPNPIDGPSTKIFVVQNIARKQREKQDFLAKQINSLLVGRGVKAKKTKKVIRLQEVGEAILREIDPSYVRPSSGNLTLETQRVVAKVLAQIVPKEIIEKAEKGDRAAAEVVAGKIEGLYAVLDHAKNRLHAKEIRKGTRQLLRPAFLKSTDAKEVRKGLKRREKTKKIDELGKAAFEVPTLPKEDKEDENTTTSEKQNTDSSSPEKKKKDEAWKPKGKLSKLAYYGPVFLPAIAHRVVLRPAKLGIKKLARPAKFVGRVAAAPFKWAWGKTYGKGFWFGTGRTALWVVGSGVTGGWPIIPAAVESAIWAFNKMRKNTKVQAAAEEAAYIGKNVVNISTLGIPLLAGDLIKRGWNKIRLKRKSEKQKK